MDTFIVEFIFYSAIHITLLTHGLLQVPRCHSKIILCLVCIYYQIIRGGDECSMGGDGCSRGMGVPGGVSVPGGWEFQGDECSRGMSVPGGMSVLGDGCLGGWEFLLPNRMTYIFKYLQNSFTSNGFSYVSPCYK